MSVEQDIYNLATIKLANLYKLAAEQAAPAPEEMPQDLRNFSSPRQAAIGAALEDAYSPYSFHNYSTPRIEGETDDEWNNRVKTPITNMYADPSVRGAEYAAALAGGFQVPRFAGDSKYIVPGRLEGLANPLDRQLHSSKFKRESPGYYQDVQEAYRNSPAVDRIRSSYLSPTRNSIIRRAYNFY